MTLFWHRKHDALSGLWRFAIQHAWTDRSPLPARRPKEPIPFIPYIYSRDELERLLDGTSTYQREWGSDLSNSLQRNSFTFFRNSKRVSELRWR